MGILLLGVNTELSFGHIEVEMLSEHLDGDVRIQADTQERQLDALVWTSG